MLDRRHGMMGELCRLTAFHTLLLPSALLRLRPEGRVRRF